MFAWIKIYANKNLLRQKCTKKKEYSTCPPFIIITNTKNIYLEKRGKELHNK